MPSTTKRVALFDEKGQRLRGKENKEAAEVALARERIAWEGETSSYPAMSQAWLKGSDFPLQVKLVDQSE